MKNVNMGRSYCPKTDYDKALKGHANPEVIKAKLQEAHEWLSPGSVHDRTANGWEAAYDLRVWKNYPGDGPNMSRAVLYFVTFGWMGASGGPTQSSKRLTSRLRKFWSQ
uniref:Uncharacterized protein n=1 Tax=Cyclophora tenuis TaxID=216820 RepID=A0A7S1DBK2_CYCTE|mmetsp:Transcript_6184/g.10766  ORF Transcript_6184/g.10766 Transcript_6184/m.10766 type:complete len:109 (+) Transcript_6184:2-328(+)